MYEETTPFFHHLSFPPRLASPNCWMGCVLCRCVLAASGHKKNLFWYNSNSSLRYIHCAIRMRWRQPRVRHATTMVKMGFRRVENVILCSLSPYARNGISQCERAGERVEIELKRSFYLVKYNNKWYNRHTMHIKTFFHPNGNFAFDERQQSSTSNNTRVWVLTRVAKYGTWNGTRLTLAVEKFYLLKLYNYHDYIVFPFLISRRERVLCLHLRQSRAQVVIFFFVSMWKHSAIVLHHEDTFCIVKLKANDNKS